MSIAGQRCPEIEFAPRTPEGRAVAEVMQRWGVWKRGGMSGHVIGLDLAEAMVSIPAELDRCFVTRLLVIAESRFVPAWLRHAEETKDRRD